MTDEITPSPSRRKFFKGLSLIPVTAVALSGCTKASPDPATPATLSGSPAQAYKPEFFNDAEWAFVNAACDRLIPADDIGPGALEAGVPEFLDRHMQTPYAAGDIWYMQGPFLEAAPQFGYQGRLALRDILRVGMKAVDAHCNKTFSKPFAQLDHSQQEAVLKEAEAGKLQLDDISSKLFFSQLLSETRSGFFADPRHGGNKDMGAWKMIGYPGMRADYLDWVEVRDKPYPLPAVDLSGRRA